MENKEFDYIIIGGGVAGLSSGMYASRGGLKTVILENFTVGGQLMQIADLENYPGIFPSQNGLDFIENLKNQAISFGTEIESAKVLSVDKIGKKFIVKTKDCIYSAFCVCIATGATHRKLDVQGENELIGKGVSYCATCDGPFFRNKKIFVVGGGDSACSEAIFLTKFSNDVSIIHRRDSFRAQKSVVDKMLNLGVKPIYNSIIKKINGTQKVESITVQNILTNEQNELSADALFVFVGILPQTDLVEMIQKDENGYIITKENMETSIPGFFAVGDIRQKSFRQVVTAAADGAIAANSAREYLEKIN